MPKMPYTNVERVERPTRPPRVRRTEPVVLVPRDDQPRPEWRPIRKEES